MSIHCDCNIYIYIYIYIYTYIIGYVYETICYLMQIARDALT